MHDKYRKRFRMLPASERVRHQIALEAARRLIDLLGLAGAEGEDRLSEATESDYYAAKRKAAAVLGHRVRPGDLPSDSEVREQVLALSRSRTGSASSADEPPQPASDEWPEGQANQVDRFALYKMRLEPLESVKQNPRSHPEGDALYHSLQVFELARAARPFDEEFLVAALLHDVGKAIDPRDHAAASVEALRGTVTGRTLWLIEHLKEAYAHRDRSLSPRARQALGESEFFDDLMLLRELDEAGRVSGTAVGTVVEALDYLRSLEQEDYLGK